MRIKKTIKKLKIIALGSLLTYVLTPTASAKTSNSDYFSTSLERYLSIPSQQQTASAKTPNSNPFSTSLERSLNLNNPPKQQIEILQQYSQLPSLETTEIFQQYFLLSPPETIEDHANFFNKSLAEEAKREKTLFRYQEAQNIVLKYSLHDPKRQQRVFDEFLPTEREEETLKNAYVGTIKRALNETRRASPEIKSFEEDIISFLNGYYLSIKGPKANGETNIPTLEEETRQEEIKRKRKIKILEETVKEFGRRYRAELNGRFKYNLEGITLTKIFQGIETEASLNDFQILGQKFHKLKIKAKSNQEVKTYLIKLLSNKWYARAEMKFDCFPKIEYTTLAFIKEEKNSRLVFSIRSNKQNKLQAAINLYQRF